MNYAIIPSELFLQQLRSLSFKARQLIKEKILIARNNPSHFKKITGFEFRLFRIRFSDKRKELRLVYAVKKSQIVLICILDRSNNYADLVKILQKVDL